MGRCGAGLLLCSSYCATRRERTRLAWCANDYGGNTDVAALPIERRGDACGGPVRLRQQFVLYDKISPQPPHL